MTSKETMLAAIRNNKPEPVSLPDDSFQGESYRSPEALTEAFAEILTKIGGQVCRVPGLAAVKPRIESLFPASSRVTNLVPGVGMESLRLETKAEMERLDVAILAGVLGVAENGAVWVDGANLESRVLPFICQHLVLVLSERGLVPTMHDAYGAIRMGDSDYGVFIAGPSKTADIEQSLVIGAHGPRSLTLFLTP